MKSNLKFNDDGSVTCTLSEYDFRQDIKAVFPRCHRCDVQGSYENRVDGMNWMINTIIESVTREKGKQSDDIF